MKRILSMLLLFAGLLPGRVFAPPVLRDGDLPVQAPSALLMEQETGAVLYEKNADERMAPASVTKVMTLLLILEDLEAGKIALDDVVTASARAASFGGSCVYLEEGERMSVEEMLKCITVVSANDCAVAMAEHLSGTEALFVERMNRRAQELGLSNTHFTNCTGLFDDDAHYSSARDVALMSRELMRHPQILDYSTIWMDSIRDGAFELVNTNKLLKRYEGCTGLKTGFTSLAMYCLAATAERDGLSFIAVIMHAESADSRNADAAALLNYGFANFSLCSLRPDTALPTLPVEMGRKGGVPLVIRGPSRALVPKGSGVPDYVLTLPELLSAPLEEGQQVGSLTVRLGDETVAELPVLCAEAVERIGFWGLFCKLAGSLIGL
ncbi:MAG: D-alanyl-D-alanine carboxypeptidase [Oscillospiraceae bacterium]|nr:D-alanyl-D-alanine carboxypeptidase [Oscillospiraceae bacterium]